MAYLQKKAFITGKIELQHVISKQKVLNKTEINRLRMPYIFDTSITVDIQEIVKIGDKVFELNEAIFDNANFER